MNDKANDKDGLLNDAIKASIKFEEVMDETDFDSWLDGACLCSWDEIPKNHCELLKKFINDEILIEYFEFEWVKTEKSKEIEKGKAIEVVTGGKSLLLRLNNEKTKFELKIDNGKVRVYEFTVETNGDKLDLCFTDSSKTLDYLGQSDGPFENYENKRDELRRICNPMKPKGDDKSSESGDKYSLEEDLISTLFDAKIKRLEARICSNKEDEEKEYKEVLHKLLFALNTLQTQEGDDTDKRWFVLLYNDLSICYAGLGNTSMSRGYAEEAREMIEKEDSYKSFDKNLFSFSKISTDKKQQEKLLKYLRTIDDRYLPKPLKNVKYILKGDNLIDITKNGTRIAILEIKNELCYFKRGDESDIKLGLVKNEDDKLNIYSDHDFVSSKLFELYTIALFNQAEAERRTNRYTEAEKIFKKIKNYGEKNTCLINFNHYSAILYLSLLYIDQGRGKEAIELLEKVINKLNEDDIRYWKAFIAKSQALIDQSEYDEAKCLLSNEFLEKQEYSYVLNNKNRVTSQGFKGLNYFTSCQIEKVRNTLKITKPDKVEQLNEVENLMRKNISIFKERKQKGFETKAYKHLSEIYEIMRDNKHAIKYLTKYLSNGDIGNLKKFVRHEKMEDWINDCIDLDALDSFSKELVIALKDEPEDEVKKYQDLINILIEKIKQECEDKDQLSRSERLVANLNEVVEKREVIKYKKDIFSNGSSRGEREDLSKEEIRIRLDINEKEFDSALFKRSEMKKPDHIAEVIVLRRWNSFSPGLYRESTGSLGGGYLLRINKNFSKEKNEDELKGCYVENIVIDPGYNFLQNFRSEGFRVEDIDTIIVTHSHLDHSAELLPIMDLMFQFNKRYKDTLNIERKRKRVNLCLSQGAYKKVSSYTNDSDWQKQLKDVIILEDLPEKKWRPFKGLTISAIPTPHWDLGGVKAIGLMIEIDGVEFCWDDVPEKDSERQKLIEFLMQNLQRRQKDGNWVKNAEIKIDDKKTLKVIDKENSIILKLNEKENKVTLIGIHDEETYERGFTIGVKKENGKLSIYNKICLGFTGDTPWYKEIREQIGGCDLLCVHLGSIKYQEIGYTDDRCCLKGEDKREIKTEEEKEKKFKETYTKSNHLLFFGTEDIISHYDKTKVDSLIIVGEFGEELKYGLRVDLCKKLSMGKSIHCLPGDIGQYIVIEKDGTKKVRCDFCEEFVKPNEIKTFSYGREDAIHYICKTCDNTLSELQKHAFIKHRVTRH